MYAIFAMLFGLSFYIQHDNQAQKGIDFRPRFVWRMILLMLFGLLDLMFFNWGFGLYCHCGHAASFMMGAAFIAIQFIFCTWWMKHHKRGPLEQLWCTATWFGKKK